MIGRCEKFTFGEKFHPFGDFGSWVYLVRVKFNLYLPHCGKYHKVFSSLWKLSVFLSKKYFIFFTLTIHIINHLEQFFNIYSIEQTDLRGLPQILPNFFREHTCSVRPIFHLCQIFGPKMYVDLKLFFEPFYLDPTFF